MVRALAPGNRVSPTSGSPTLRSDSILMVQSSHRLSVMCYSYCLSPILQVAERAQVLGSGLLAKGCQPNPQQFVGLFAQNRPEVHSHHFVPTLVGFL